MNRTLVGEEFPIYNDCIFFLFFFFFSILLPSISISKKGVALVAQI